MYYTQEQIDRANQADLVSFLQSQGEQLTRAGNEYRWKRHDSLTVRGNKWYRHSQSKGGRHNASAAGIFLFQIEIMGLYIQRKGPKPRRQQRQKALNLRHFLRQWQME